MITLHVDKLKEPLKAYIERVTSDKIYLGGELFGYIELPLTDILRADILKVVKIDRIMLWQHRALELYSDGTNIRARKPVMEYKNEDRA